MLTVINIIKFVGTLIPTIISIIKSIEEALPQAGLGAEKLAIIRQIFEEAYKSVAEAMPDMEKVWAVVKKVIDLFVGLFNKTGAFQK
jgi:hypothetical protein